MQLKLIFSKWTQVASILLIGGAVAWAIKLGVIIATNGRIITSGPAAFFMQVGLVLLVIGSTGIGNRLSGKLHPVLRTLAILLSPVFVVACLFVLGSVITPLFRNSSIWYAEQEAPIAIAVLFFLPIGYLLFRSSKTA
jgi:hypothetical protein